MTNLNSRRISRTRSLRALALLLAGGLFAACGEGQLASEGDEAVGEGQDALAASAECSPEAVLSRTLAGERTQVVERALRWVALQVPYDRSGTFEGYRRDCSGLVSMSCQLPAPGPSTRLANCAATLGLTESQEISTIRLLMDGLILTLADPSASSMEGGLGSLR